MKHYIYTLVITLCFTIPGYAQLPGVNTTDSSTKETKNDTENFMDLQANVYGDIFGNMMDIDAFKGIDGFMDMVNKLDASPEMKAKMTEQYQLYSNSLDPEKKEEAKAQFNALLLKAIEEGKEKEKQNP